MGRYKGPVTLQGSTLTAGPYTPQVYAETDARKLPWDKLNIDWVVDVTGKYRTREKAAEHITAGAKAVLISAPAHNDDLAIIMGVNELEFDPTKHSIISLGSCTTNAVIPLLHLVQTHYPIHAVSMTTTHAYTNSQALLDGIGSSADVRRSRAAACNIIPSSTGALELATRIMPQLQGKVTGCALRVPVSNVSMIDLVIQLEQPIRQQDLHTTLRAAAQKRPEIIALSELPLVSTDFLKDTHSVTVDLPMSTTCTTLIKLMGWYDNEYGYSARMRDFLEFTYRSFGKPL
jgi:glyceraldehyde 3-phosphate dehydrogenase